MISYGQHQFPGKLFVVEGTDGSGKSTQLALLYQWLKAEGYPVFFSEWNSSPLVKDTTRRAKKRHLCPPSTFSLLHATDFADRTERDIGPPLKAEMSNWVSPAQVDGFCDHYRRLYPDYAIAASSLLPGAAA